MGLALHSAVMARKRRVVGYLHLLQKTENLFTRFLSSRILHPLYHCQTDLTNTVSRQMHAYTCWTTIFDQRINLRYCLSNALAPRVRQQPKLLLFALH